MSSYEISTTKDGQVKDRNLKLCSQENKNDRPAEKRASHKEVLAIAFKNGLLKAIKTTLGVE